MFETKRLYLRELELTDIEAIHILHSLPETDEFNTLGIPASIQDTEELVNQWLSESNLQPCMHYVFAIHLQDTNTFIGLVGLKLGKPNYRTAETWFKLHKYFWRKGYTTEAVTELFKFGFERLKLHRIEAGCAVENIASFKVLEKVGMTREGMKRKILPIRGEWKDNYFYAMLEDDFKLLR